MRHSHWRAWYTLQRRKKRGKTCMPWGDTAVQRANICNPPFLTVIKANSIPGSAVLISSMLGPQQQSLLIHPRTAGWLPWWEDSGEMSRRSSSLPFTRFEAGLRLSCLVGCSPWDLFADLPCDGGLYRPWRRWQMTLLWAVVGLCSGKTAVYDSFYGAFITVPFYLLYIDKLNKIYSYI